VKAISDGEIKQKLIGAGIDPLQSTPQEMAAYMKSETEKWAKVINTASIKVD
jgi:tripartite-type tricarboxylate transporter receptor subunit TctC